MSPYPSMPASRKSAPRSPLIVSLPYVEPSRMKRISGNRNVKKASSLLRV